MDKLVPINIHIVIVNFNSGEWLSRALTSALEFSDAIISVVDNASTDESLELAKSLFRSERIDWISNDNNVGFAAANNQVLKNIDSDFAVLMNPDCEIREGTLTEIINAFDANPRYGIASCRILNEDLSLQPTCRRYFPTPWSALVRMLKLNRLFPNSPHFADFDYGNVLSVDEPVHEVEAISGAFMVVRKRAIEEVGLLDEGYFMHCEDLDWCKRFELAGWQVGFVPSAEVLHAKGVSSKSRPVKVLWTLHKGMNRFFDKFYRKQYSLPLRMFVKVGIYLSFITRSALAIMKSWFKG